jgi:hypothetical protein
MGYGDTMGIMWEYSLDIMGYYIGTMSTHIWLYLRMLGHIQYIGQTLSKYSVKVSQA